MQKKNDAEGIRQAAQMVPGYHAHEAGGHIHALPHSETGKAPEVGEVRLHTHGGDLHEEYQHARDAVLQGEGSISGEMHVHVLEDGTVVQHTHSHHHTHTHQNTKAVLNRLSRAIGHMESIKRMVEDGRDCSEVLIQLAAVKSAINNTGKVILHDHIEHCMVDAVRSGDMQEIEELQKAIDLFVK